MVHFQNLNETIGSISNGEARIIDFDTNEPSITSSIKDSYYCFICVWTSRFKFSLYFLVPNPTGNKKVALLTLHAFVDGVNIGMDLFYMI